jgi:hypothetical protein
VLTLGSTHPLWEAELLKYAEKFSWLVPLVLIYLIFAYFTRRSDLKKRKEATDWQNERLRTVLAPLLIANVPRRGEMFEACRSVRISGLGRSNGSLEKRHKL